MSCEITIVLSTMGGLIVGILGTLLVYEINFRQTMKDFDIKLVKKSCD